MTRPDPPVADGERRTGVVRRPNIRQRPSTARRDWIALISVGALGAVILIVLAGMFNGPANVVVPSASATPVDVAIGPSASLPVFTQEPSTPPTPPITPKPRISFIPSPSPTPSPTPTPTPSPTPTPTPSPTPVPVTPPPPTAPPPGPTSQPGTSPTPTFPLFGLVILDPENGRATTDSVITVHGLAAPGTTITREVPWWFDEHVVADSFGRWVFALQLNIGDNSFSFRIGDDLTTVTTLVVHRFAT